MWSRGGGGASDRLRFIAVIDGQTTGSSGVPVIKFLLALALLLCGFGPGLAGGGGGVS